MIKLLFTTIFGSYLLGCKTTGQATRLEFFRDSIPIITFCDLPKFAGRPVYLTSYYSGIDEYWSLKNIKQKACSSKLTVDLQFAGYNPFNPPEKFEKVFREAHENYHDTYLLIKAVGVFEQDRKNGYGHLGSNNARFVISEIIEASFIRK
jgi:hypothetical protein